MRTLKFLFCFVLLFAAAGTAVVLANHNGAVVSHSAAACGETTFTASVADPAGGHLVSNMYLVVDVNGSVQNARVPIDGSTASITVGPFF